MLLEFSVSLQRHLIVLTKSYWYIHFYGIREETLDCFRSYLFDRK